MNTVHDRAVKIWEQLMEKDFLHEDPHRPVVYMSRWALDEFRDDRFAQTEMNYVNGKWAWRGLELKSIVIMPFSTFLGLVGPDDVPAQGSPESMAESWERDIAIFIRWQHRKSYRYCYIDDPDNPKYYMEVE